MKLLPRIHGTRIDRLIVHRIYWFFRMRRHAIVNRWRTLSTDATNRISVAIRPLAIQVVARFDARASAFALLHLNRFAQEERKGAKERELIYAIKTLLVRDFYERGYCIRCVKQTQTLPCWECGGQGGDSEENNWEPCWKCHGTGVHASHVLYKFTFKIGKRQYSWHQPERFVDWSPALTSDGVGTFRAGRKKNIIKNRIVLAFLYDIALEYIRRAIRSSARRAQSPRGDE